MAFKPSREHKALCRQVSKILKSYDRYFAWTWEWERRVIPADVHPTLGQVAMSINIFDYILEVEIFVHPRALELTPDQLELTILHELGHVFLSEMNMALFHISGAAGPNWKKPGPWKDAEERTCWRFARSMLALKAAHE